MSNANGINLGSGEKWPGPVGWMGLDKVNEDYLDRRSRLPFKDGSVENIYSSHFFEHIDDHTAQNLLKESYRVLCDKGVIRIVVPDFEKFVRKYIENDMIWFAQTVGFSGRQEWPNYDVEPSITNLLLHWLSNYDFEGPNGFYRGPPFAIDPKLVREKAETLNLGDFYSWISTFVPKNDTRITPQHINWWTFEKVEHHLETAGFRYVRRCSYGMTQSPSMATNAFDAWKPNRRPFSLYTEAVKESI